VDRSARFDAPIRTEAVIKRSFDAFRSLGRRFARSSAATRPSSSTRGRSADAELGVWVEALTEILEAESALPKARAALGRSGCSRNCAAAIWRRPRRVHRFTKSWRENGARVPVHAYVRMSFAPGEAYQFDWSPRRSHSRTPLTVKAAHMKLSHSRMPFVRVYFRETQELVFDAHDKAFQFYGVQHGDI